MPWYRQYIRDKTLKDAGVFLWPTYYLFPSINHILTPPDVRPSRHTKHHGYILRAFFQVSTYVCIGCPKILVQSAVMPILNRTGQDYGTPCRATQIKITLKPANPAYNQVYICSRVCANKSFPYGMKKKVFLNFFVRKKIIENSHMDIRFGKIIFEIIHNFVEFRSHFATCLQPRSILSQKYINLANSF